MMWEDVNTAIFSPSGGNVGMQTMDSALMALVEGAQIDGKEAYLQANNKSKFERFRREG